MMRSAEISGQKTGLLQEPERKKYRKEKKWNKKVEKYIWSSYVLAELIV